MMSINWLAAVDRWLPYTIDNPYMQDQQPRLG